MSVLLFHDRHFLSLSSLNSRIFLPENRYPALADRLVNAGKYGWLDILTGRFLLCVLSFFTAINDVLFQATTGGDYQPVEHFFEKVFGLLTASEAYEKQSNSIVFY